MKLTLPAGSFAAYLFDCDGTLVDSMPLHYVAWRRALAEWDCTFDEQVFYEWGGIPVAEIISLLNEKQGLRMPVEHVSSRKESLYLEMLPQLRAILRWWSISTPSTGAFPLRSSPAASGTQ